jgi:hypothetical protein
LVSTFSRPPSEGDLILAGFRNIFSVAVFRLVIRKNHLIDNVRLYEADCGTHAPVPSQDG